MSHSLLVGRLVSGLGLASTATLTRLTPGETTAAPLVLLVTGAGWTLPGFAAWMSSFSSHPGSQFSASTGPAVSSAAMPALARLRQQGGGLQKACASPCAPHARAGVAAAAASYSAAAAAAAPTGARAEEAPSAGPAGPRDLSTGLPRSGAHSGTTAVLNEAAGGGEDEDTTPPPDPKPDLVEKFLSLDMCGSGVRRRAERQDVLRDFQRHPADTGSPPVMVALWTHRVRSLVRVFDAGRKQLPSIRHLEMLVHKRRRMLTWLRRTDFESYSYTISKLGLRDIYVPAGGPYRYREGVRVSDPVDDDLNRLRFNFHTKYRQDKTSLWRRLRPQLVAEDPTLQAADAEAAVEDRQRRQQRRQVAAQQRMAAERERERDPRR